MSSLWQGCEEWEGKPLTGQRNERNKPYEPKELNEPD